MTLYCFSATGNTLTTARMLAGQLGMNGKIVPLASLRPAEGEADKEIPVTDDCVGFLYPVYHGDVPFLVRDRIEHMRFAGQPYLFSVCTCRGYDGQAAARMEKVLADRGQHLALHEVICMPGNSRLSTGEETIKMLREQPARVKDVAERVLAREKESYETEALAPSPSITAKACNERGMKADQTCDGCGICVRVCPMDNIHLEDGSAVFGDQCTTCLACFHWCPKEAVYMSRTDGALARRKKYHHPQVTLEDICREKSRD